MYGDVFGRRGAPLARREAEGLSPGELYDRNLTYAAGRCPARRLLPAALDLARREETTLTGLISHRLPLSDGVDAYRRLAAREEGLGKVILLP